MIRSFFTVTFRILWRNKVTSFVNIFSLSVGIAASIFIMLYVLHETSYDKFHANYDRIYRLEGDEFGKLPPAIGIQVKDNVPEVENVALLAMGFRNFITYYPEDHTGQIKQIEVNRLLADSTTFSVFSFSFTQGDPKQALKNPMTCVITETTAHKLFGDINPMGKSLELETQQYLVTGVIQDVKMSHVEIDMIISLSSFKNTDPQTNFNNTGASSWAWSATYLLMKPEIDKEAVEEKINKVLSDYKNGTLVDTRLNHFHIRSLSELYFNGEVEKLSYGLHGNFRNVLILSAIGIFLLILACINYVNLTTARSGKRSKEFAIKKVNGSSASLLRTQLIGESVLIMFISMAVAVTIVQLFLPGFNELTNMNISLWSSVSPLVWASLFGVAILIGILAGIYPSFYLTAFHPMKAMKGMRSGPDGLVFRNGLMIFQFTLSIILIVAILVNFRQLNYLMTSDLGFDQSQVVCLIAPDGSDEERSLRETFRTRLMQHTGVHHVTYSAGLPGFVAVDFPTLEVNGEQRSIKGCVVDDSYLDVFGLSLVDGRNFTSHDGPKTNSDERTIPVILNETAVREFGFSNPIGQVIHSTDSPRSKVEIIGVVEDFHFWSLHKKIEPLALVAFGTLNVSVSIRIAPTNISATLKQIENEWHNVFGGIPFTYRFLDESFNMQYQRDQQLAKVIGYFTGLAVIIACLGLFALSSFLVSNRTKEIGVRKVLGASVSTIYSMLSWDFLKWILVATIIACPVAWYLMHLWLETFAYHITIGADIFIIAALLAIGIALLTITGQSLKAANANPVKSLRYE